MMILPDNLERRIHRLQRWCHAAVGAAIV